eukprot:3933539-Rhodomonas_salina.5
MAGLCAYALVPSLLPAYALPTPRNPIDLGCRYAMPGADILGSQADLCEEAHGANYRPWENCGTEEVSCYGSPVLTPTRRSVLTLHVCCY